ncbi:hypothetical protein [Kitasatospora sp. MAP5-34]|uniref:hypothetical protein n=1 Tax=Kitasatospora sp. MAP5-34 TaxID=3035102 RepID=UPI0024769AC1|nr:hypothetical protein [Kitasatospora sp. MAP5-34]MDH6576222.1 hypothetical protein [Kitasatospora sp. MAP5-34]
MTPWSFHKAALAGCAAVLLVAAPAAAGEVPCGPDLRVTAENPAPVHPGGTTRVHAVVLNNGNSETADPFTLTLSLPPGVDVTPPFSPSTCQVFPFGHTIACTFPAGLRPGQTDTADIPISVAQGMPAGVLTGRLDAQLPAAPTPVDNTATFDIVVL